METKTATAKEVHAEFDRTGIELLSEANKILTDNNSKDKELAEKMKQLGFENAVSVKEDAKQMEEANAVVYFNRHYPLNKFFTEQAIEKVCVKYGLLFAKSDKYKGEIPMKNQLEIVNFKLREKDMPNVKLVKAELRDIGSGNMSMVSALFLGIDVFRDPSKYIKSVSVKEFSENKEKYLAEGWTDSSAFEYHIVAQPEFLNMVNIAVENEYKVVDKDPVVFRKVKGGYLLVSCWGNEASQEEFQNPINN